MRIDTTSQGDALWGYCMSNSDVTSNEILFPSDYYLNLACFYDRGISEQAMAMIVFPISNLAGVNLLPGSATLNYYAVDESTEANVDLYHNAGNHGPAADLAYASLGNSIADNLNLPNDFNGVQPGWQSVDVTAQLQSDINNGCSYSVFIFRVTDWEMFYPQQAWATIGSSDGGKGAYINVVPEPASALVLLTGFCGGGALLKRRVK